MTEEIIPVDKEWFQSRIRDLGYSQRGFARKIGIHHSTLGLLITGRRRLTIPVAAAISSGLQIPIEIVMAKAAVTSSWRREGETKVVGLIKEDGRVVRKEDGKAILPISSSGDVEALRAVGKPPMAGWVFFYTPRNGIEIEAMGKLCLVETTEDNLWLGTLLTKTEEGQYRVACIDGRRTLTAFLHSASPVVWIKP